MTRIDDINTHNDNLRLYVDSTLMCTFLAVTGHNTTATPYNTPYIPVCTHIQHYNIQHVPCYAPTQHYNSNPQSPVSSWLHPHTTSQPHSAFLRTFPDVPLHIIAITFRYHLYIPARTPTHYHNNILLPPIHS